ncbi:MAG: hypothetical protein QXI39_08445 [Candidatus Bathyarchaeia archaeon]
MEPHVGKIAFNIALLLFLLALIPLPIVRRDSAEFIIDLIALALTLLFLGLIIWDIRRQVKKSLGETTIKET